MTEWICESCVHYPPSSGDGKPCSMCDNDIPVLDFYFENEVKDNNEKSNSRV